MSEPSKEQIAELAVTYAALILHDDGVDITADKLNSILKASNVSVPAYYPSLFQRVFASRNLDDLLASSSASAGPAPVAPAGGAAAGGAASDDGAKKKDDEKAKAKEKEEKEEEVADADMGSLFGGDDEDEGW